MRSKNRTINIIVIWMPKKILVYIFLCHNYLREMVWYDFAFTIAQEDGWNLCEITFLESNDVWDRFQDTDRGWIVISGNSNWDDKISSFIIRRFRVTLRSDGESYVISTARINSCIGGHNRCHMNLGGESSCVRCTCRFTGKCLHSPLCFSYENTNGKSYNAGNCTR